MDDLNQFNMLWHEIEKDITAIGSIYPSVGKQLYDEPRQRLAQRIARKMLGGEYKTTKILNMISRTTLANNLCPDHRDKIQGRSCLMCEIERSDKLKLSNIRWARALVKEE